GLQDVSGPLPDIAQLMQLPAHRPLGPPAVVPPGQMLLEQLDGPFRIAIAPIPRWSLHGRAQHGEEIVVPGGEVTMPPGIAEGPGRRCQEVAIEPVVDRLGRDAQVGGDRRDRSPLIELQEGQGPTEGVGLVGPVAGPAQAVSLLGCEVEVHRTPPGRRSGSEWRGPFHHRTSMRTRPGQKTPEKQGPGTDYRGFLADDKEPSRRLLAQSPAW